MALAENALTLLATVKAELGLTDTANDALLERYINAASDMFLNMVDRNLVKTAYTDVKVSGTDLSVLYLPEWPIISVESYESVGSESYEIINAGQESSHLYTDTVFKRFNKVFGDLSATYYGDSILSITISYTAGYCTPKQADESECTRTLPYDIEEAVIAMVVLKYKQWCSQTQGMVKYSAGKRTFEWKSICEMCEVQEVVDKYRRTL